MKRFSAALSTHVELDAAVDECVARAMEPMQGSTPNLGVFFVSHEHHSGFEELAGRIKEATGVEHLVGCAGETIVGQGREVEAGAALSLWLAHLPDATLNTFRMQTEVQEGDDGMRRLIIRGMPDFQADTPEDVAARRLSLMVLTEPFSFPAAEWLEQVNQHCPGMPVFGGIASGGMAPGSNRLFYNGSCLKSGAVGVMMEGVSLRHVVSQGCRPIGKPMVITRGHDNVIEQMAGQTPLVQLQSLMDSTEGEEREILKDALQGGGLHIGQAVDERTSNPGRGDFLVRTVMRLDKESGAMEIGDWARRGRTVRFHVRDDQSADEDLIEMLAEAGRGTPPGGALLFSCNGRGTRLFDEPDHDAGALARQFEELAVSGFFAQGEIGPVGGRNFLHGFTASIALFDAD